MIRQSRVRVGVRVGVINRGQDKIEKDNQSIVSLPVDTDVHELYRQLVEVRHRQLVQQHFGFQTMMTKKIKTKTMVRR